MKSLKWLVMVGVCLKCGCCVSGCTATDATTLTDLLSAVNVLVELVKTLAGAG